MWMPQSSVHRGAALNVSDADPASALPASGMAVTMADLRRTALRPFVAGTGHPGRRETTE
jgi:hypothetical protein